MLKIQKTKEEWAEILPPQVYEVTRNHGTEPAFDNLYSDNHAEGLYRCANCGLNLFKSKHKFESGTGWPSFYKPYKSNHIIADIDPDGTRTEIKCARCDAHLGHVFNDGPEPTGLRYCMNSTALIFTPETWQESDNYFHNLE